MITKTILPEFQEFLLSNKLAPEKHIHFLAIWASRFLAFSNIKGQQDIGHTVAEFLSSLEAKEDIKDWQIRQASDAVQLYLNNFKGREVLSLAQGTPKPPACLADSQQLLAEMKRLIRLKHFAYNTELAYLDWAERFFTYISEISNNASSSEITAEHVQNYLSHLAVVKKVSSSTQNQALCALVFLFRDVLGQELGDISGMVWAKRGKKLPVVLWVEEVRSIFQYLSGTSLLIAQLLYGSGLRIMEVARLRVLDVDFEGNQLMVRNAKGDKDRSTVLPEAAKGPLRLHMEKVKALHDKDLSAGYGEVYMPNALERKFPNAAKEWKWQYVFPSSALSVDPRSGKVRRCWCRSKRAEYGGAGSLKIIKKTLLY